MKACACDVCVCVRLFDFPSERCHAIFTARQPATAAAALGVVSAAVLVSLIPCTHKLQCICMHVSLVLC